LHGPQRMVLADQRLIERVNIFTKLFDGRAARLILVVNPDKNLKPLFGAHATVKQLFHRDAPKDRENAISHPPREVQLG
jgi:hypothetical protein